MTEEMQAKREKLKALSAEVAPQVGEDAEFQTINEALVDLYQQHGHEEIHSFKQWLQKGFVVKRGEKALLLWGQPQKATKQEKQTGDEKDEFKFFPLAYVFSNLQVEPLKQKKNEKALSGS